MQTATCGGTSALLPSERLKATFDVSELTLVIDGSAERTKRRRFLWSESDSDNQDIYFLGREQLVKRHVEKFIAVHKKYFGKFIPTADDILLMSAVAKNGGALGMHYGAFLPTIMQQCTDEQRAHWLPKCFSLNIVGCLAQTELGHGSNVRGLQTTAIYDVQNQEFVLNTPTLQSLKWWPGGLAKTATHCAVYAQLISGGKEYGFHVFILQIRDHEHKPLPGVELGDIGPKIGNNSMETGYMRLTNVRIPRNWMMMRNQQVQPDGRYTKTQKSGNARLAYGTMLSIRAALVSTAGLILAQGATIAVRYSCVRHQGFINAGDNTRLGEEWPIMDYQVQCYRVLKQVATAYAFIFTGQYVQKRYDQLMKGIMGEDDTSDLPEVHATSAGLKALCTFVAADGLEDLRKCCGGHGVMLASGIAQLATDYVTTCTAEGDRIILELQTARFLMKQLQVSRQKEPLSGACEYLKPLNCTDFNPNNSTCNAVDFHNSDTLLELFKFRALKTTWVAGQRLDEERHGQNYESAWNSCAVDLVHAARCHCYFIVLRNFTLMTAALAEGPVRKVLNRLCSLFALQHIQENVGDWLGHLSHIQVRAIRAAVRQLLLELRPDSVALVDAFEFPDAVLNSALGRHDGNVYEALYEHAKKSPLNARDPFDGYEQHLRPLLDLDFLRDGASCVRQHPTSKSKL
eukprot:TRINITY_DN810_c0_g1_i1.p1 TRINITY_DN810_c0_g1~~TRINITY_DN810_c0_g1_i1.p1  ORF type:complete len:686 (+),score=83.60 TRINITY_DN810_c0_g1_i1:2454-4511(+)